MKNIFKVGFQLIVICCFVITFFLPNVYANDTTGKWEGPFCWPVQGTHMIHLHTGKVLMFPGHFNDEDNIEAWLWNFGNTSKNCFGNKERLADQNNPNPDPECFSLIENEESNLFCSGHAAMGDGSVLVTGGHYGQSGGFGAHVGLADANIFNPKNETWSGPDDGVASMAERRWYPTVTTLPDDSMLVVSGSNRKCVGGSNPGTTCDIDSDCTGGGTCSDVQIIDVPEIFDSGLHSGLPNSSWTSLANSSSLGIPFYPLMFVLPDGKVFYGGSEFDQGNPTVTSSDNYILDLSNDTWTFIDNSGNVAGGSAVMYEPGKILKAGGMTPSTACNVDADCGADNTCAPTGFCAGFFNSPSANALTIDMTAGGSKTWQGMGTSMSTGRIRMNLTLLADGSALATGGNRSRSNTESNLRCDGGTRDGGECTLDPFAHPGSQCNITNDPPKRSEDCPGGGQCCPSGDCNAGVFEQFWVAETDLWNPDTGLWSQMESMQTPRMYHSTAILLPDGRVVMAGGGQGAGAIHNFHTYEIFSPPYLFDGNNLATRPTVSGVPEAVNYGQSFSVNTPDSANISKVGLVRLAAATHGFDQNQRYVPLNFSDNGGSLGLDAPANGNIAPPGYYMLFLVNNDGVPAVGEYIRVSEAPVAKCQNATVSTDPGVCIATGVSIDNGSFDPGGDNISLSQTPDNPYDLGMTDVTLKVTDTNNTFSDICEAKVTVEDNENPTITAPNDVIHECDSPGGCLKENVALGTPVTGDNCSVASVVNNAPDFFPLGETIVQWTVTDGSGNTAIDTQKVTVVDTTPPEVFCNSPALITPSDAPISFTATAEDICDPDLAAPVITEFDCFKFTKKGKRIDKTESCVVSFTGDTVTIHDSGGVGDIIEWTAQATDASGNVGSATCTVNVVRKKDL